MRQKGAGGHSGIFSLSRQGLHAVVKLVSKGRDASYLRTVKSFRLLYLNCRDHSLLILDTTATSLRIGSCSTNETSVYHTDSPAELKSFQQFKVSSQYFLEDNEISPQSIGIVHHHRRSDSQLDSDVESALLAAALTHPEAWVRDESGVVVQIGKVNLNHLFRLLLTQVLVRLGKTVGREKERAAVCNPQQRRCYIHCGHSKSQNPPV